jgi:hypothetical protein
MSGRHNLMTTNDLARGLMRFWVGKDFVCNIFGNEGKSRSYCTYALSFRPSCVHRSGNVCLCVLVEHGIFGAKDCESSDENRAYGSSSACGSPGQTRTYSAEDSASERSAMDPSSRVARGSRARG